MCVCVCVHVCVWLLVCLLLGSLESDEQLWFRQDVCLSGYLPTSFIGFADWHSYALLMVCLAWDLCEA